MNEDSQRHSKERFFFFINQSHDDFSEAEVKSTHLSGERFSHENVPDYILRYKTFQLIYIHFLRTLSQAFSNRSVRVFHIYHVIFEKLAKYLLSFSFTCAFLELIKRSPKISAIWNFA